MESKQVLKFELSPKDIQIKRILNKEFLELDIMAISDIYPNRNKSAFTLESMEASKDSCFNKPILGCFDTIINDFKEHNGEDEYDKELQNTYWDTSGPDAEKILGLIRESDTVQIIEQDGLHWLNITCAIWTFYSYKQVKKLLKSKKKKVSVEVIVNKSHFDEDGIQVIDDFTLTGITILGDRVLEGIPGAHLNILDLMSKDSYAKQVQCLSFAYNKKDVELDQSNFDMKNSEQMEGKRMTYQEKLTLLDGALKDVYGEGEERCCGYYICDFSDDFVIVHDYEEGKYFKIPFSLTIDEDKMEITFDLEGKIEQLPTYKDIVRESVKIDDQDKNIDEVFALYTEAQNTISELNSKVYSIVIDEVEYNVESLKEKYDADMAAKEEECKNAKEECEGALEECKNAKEELCNLKAEMEKDAADKLCGEGMALVDDEDELDDDDKEEIKEKCSKHSYASLSEVEDDIARALYQKKKNNRSKSFKAGINTGKPKADDDANISVFDKL